MLTSTILLAATGGGFLTFAQGFLFKGAAFILALGVLIFVHELGHFLAAKAAGIGVPRFSIGFGPATPLCFRRGETEYRVAWIPLGGYVKMASREEQEAMAALEGGIDEEYPPEKLFENKPLGWRILAISAGVIMNALFAWGVYAAISYTYGTAHRPTTTVQQVDAAALPEGAEELANLTPGTQIKSIDGKPVETWEEIVQGIIDPTSERLVLGLAEGGTLEAEIPGLDNEARMAIALALQPRQKIRLTLVDAGKPAAEAGLQAGDLVVAVAGEPVTGLNSFIERIGGAVGESLALTVERGEETFEAVVVPEASKATNPETQEEIEVGRIGIGLQLDYVRVRYGLWESAVEGLRETGKTSGLVVFALGKMVTGGISPRELGGPIAIADAAGQMARAGLEPFLALLAFLSINLAILNLLPIPVLDGGHLVFLIAEGLRGGRPLPTEWRIRLTQVGLVLVLGLMSLAIFNDILRVATQ